MTQAQSDFKAWTSDVRSSVNGALKRYFDDKRTETADVSPRAEELLDAVESLTMRGGKRLRPVVAAAAFSAVNEDVPGDRLATLGAALELLQTYLLIHDDWMDQDATRRGGPSVHFSFRDAHPEHVADSLAILAGDLACAWSWELMLACDFGASQGRALESFTSIQKDVIAGQQLDLLADPDVDRMQRLKTGSYTVRGPAVLGGLLGGGSTQALAALEAWSEPLGIAFQLRDDLIGTFGNAKDSGKPGDDLIHGKLNAVVKAFRAIDVPAESQRVVDNVFGSASASTSEVDAAIKVLIESGARDQVEARLSELVGNANAALNEATLVAEGKARLLMVASALTDRGH